MKKIMFTLAFMLVLPVSTWQTWNPNTGLFTVHKTESSTSDICFSGQVEDYNGLCTSPSNPNIEYIEKLLRLRREK